MNAKQVTVKLRRDEANSWRASVWAGGVLLESYVKKMTLSEGVNASKELFRTGVFPDGRIGKGMGDSDDSELVKIDGLVEFHLEAVLAALFKAVEREPSHGDVHIVRPHFEFSLEVSYGHPE